MCSPTHDPPLASAVLDETILADAACILDSHDTLLVSATTTQPTTLSFNLRSHACSSNNALTAVVGLPLCRDPESRAVWVYNQKEKSLSVYDPLLLALPKETAGMSCGVIVVDRAVTSVDLCVCVCVCVCMYVCVYFLFLFLCHEKNSFVQFL